MRLTRSGRHFYWDRDKSCWLEKGIAYGPRYTYTQLMSLPKGTDGDTFMQVDASSESESRYISNPTHYYTPEPYLRPYEGFDHKKWPRTFMCLLQLYHMQDWWTGKTKYDYQYPKHIGGNYLSPEERLKV